MSFRPFVVEEFYDWICKLNAVEPLPRGSVDPYWTEAEMLTRYVNKKCREKGLRPTVLVPE